MSGHPSTVLLTLEDVSERLQIPVATLRLWRNKGQGPRFVRMGRHLRITEEELARWIEERESLPRVSTSEVVDLLRQMKDVHTEGDRQDFMAAKADLLARIEEQAR